ncbi:hypothetical protein [Kitasatospora paracochleata]|uniref:Uncharacterized protein n=1 Tax=Kitasatospora paracochleata TaxID=58354 RepID=A0ABT1J971_9ACTN|nr:hypothetical protein [Kitasatospora paracochleata]MCP2313987.1 hypothetical protein [Kitasatospora paracochleata]
MGNAGSEEPLILPLEAIELDAFRQRHAEDTFWCGLLLGGCGAQLATKLYTDRVCHFAHFPDPTGEHVCGRRARSVSSADHLYAKAAAAAWLKTRGQRAGITFALPLGSVVDISWGVPARGLRLHLDGAVEPVWDDEAVEPVLGMSSLVDDETLVRRWYVHRVRFESVGTARRMLIGTQAFARQTEWFGLDECSMTADGFRTPAVDRIVEARRSPRPQAAWRPAALGERTAHRSEFERRLDTAIESRSRVAVVSLVRELEAAGQARDSASGTTAALIERGRTWLTAYDRGRGELFDRLRQAVAMGDTELVRHLLVRVDTDAAWGRTEDQRSTAEEAAELLRQQERAVFSDRKTSRAVVPADVPGAPTASRAAEPDDPADTAQQRVLDILGDLRQLGEQLPARQIQHLVDSLAGTVRKVRPRLTPAQLEEAQWWLSRGRRLRGALASESGVAPRREAGVPAARQDTDKRAFERLAARTGIGRMREDREVVREQPAARRSASGVPQRQRARKAVPARPARLPEEAVAQIAAAVTGALKKAARERSTTTWSRLGRQLGNALPQVLHPADRVEVLVRVDAGTPQGEPLLSSLLAAGDTGSLAVCRDLAGRLGRAVPAEPGEARVFWQSEVLRLQQLFRYR